MLKDTSDDAKRLRIAMMLESDGPGGAEIMVLRLSQELRRMGHWILQVGPENGVGWLGEQFRNAGFDTATCTHAKVLDLTAIRRMQGILQQYEIDVVHSHEFEMAVYGTVASKLRKLRHVITMHGSSTVMKSLRRRLALRWAFRNSDATITVAASTQSQMAEDLRIDRNSIAVIHNGVPDVRGSGDQIRQTLGIRPDEVVVIATGNLDPRKSHRTLLEALYSLSSRGLDSNWHVLIAGGRGGPEHEKLVGYARAKGFGERLHVLLNRTDVPDLLAASDIFVMPSLWEGLPMALLEAMLAGKACIASSVGGIPEAVTDGIDGLLFPAADVSALAGRLGPLLADSELRRRFGLAARERALREFTVGTMAKRYEQAYLDPIRSRGSD